MKLNFIIPVFFICILLFNNCNNKKNNPDEDILALLLDKPNKLQFVNCKEGSGQIVLEAKYKVSGANAHLIEEFLHKTTGMNKLKFLCCGWESHPAGKIEISEKFDNIYKTLYNYNYISISMYSEETLITDRSKWDEILNFYIIVEVLNI